MWRDRRLMHRKQHVFTGRLLGPAAEGLHHPRARESVDEAFSVGVAVFGPRPAQGAPVRGPLRYLRIPPHPRTDGQEAYGVSAPEADRSPGIGAPQGAPLPIDGSPDGRNRQRNRTPGGQAIPSGGNSLPRVCFPGRRWCGARSRIQVQRGLWLHEASGVPLSGARWRVSQGPCP